MKNRKSKWVWGSIFLFVFIITILIFIFHETILLKAGEFMAPDGNYTADVAIMEGNEFIDRGIVKNGMNLLSSGKVKRVVVILYRIAQSSRPFALNEDYPNLVKKELEAIGLKGKDFEIIVTHIHHPVTLTAAKGALEVLSQENVKSAILLSQGFHTRRSFLAYQYASLPFQIKIFPSACFNSYQLNNWWVQESGVRDFADELAKLGYYLAGGYIPFKFSY